MSEIMNCPFCNGRAIMRERFINGVANVKHYRLECVDCHASFLNWNKNTSKAIAAWNRRAQPENEPLTLDDLRQMGGEPIWIKEFPPYAFAGYKVLSLRVVDVYGDIVCEDGDIYEYERYGKTWLAYRSKPKEEV